MSKRRVRGYPPALLKPMPSHFSSSDDEEENSGRRRLTRHEKRELEKRDYEKARKMQEEENRKKPVGFRQRQPSPVVEFARTLDLGSTVPQAEAGDNRGSNAYDDMDDVNADADESYQPEGNKTGNDTDSGDSDYRVGETDDFNATTDEDNREPAATRRRGRKRKKLYYRGVKIKVPRGFFSKWTTVQRGNWTTQTKKDYQLPPYNVHEDDDAKERHDARRERERVNKSNSRGFAKLKKMLRVALEDGATSTSTKRPEVELEYSKDEVAKELNRYGLAVPDGIEEQVIVLLKLVRGLTLTATNVLQSRSESPARPSETAVPKELKQLQLESAYETGMVTPMETAAPTEEKLQAHLRAAEQTIERLNRRLAERTEQLKDERDTSKVFASTTRHFAANAGYIMQLEDDPDRQIRHNDHTIGVLTGHVNRLRRGGFERYAFNDEECYECHLRGTVILCDYCPRSFHYVHCNPPLNKNSLPTGLYKCMYCRQLGDSLDGLGIEVARVLTGIQKEEEEEDDADLIAESRNENIAIDSDGEYYVVDETDVKGACSMKHDRSHSSTRPHIEMDPSAIDILTLPPKLHLDNVDWSTLDKEIDKELLKKKAEESTDNESDSECYMYSSEDEKIREEMKKMPESERKKTKKKLKKKKKVREEVEEMLRTNDEDKKLDIYLPKNLKKWYISKTGDIPKDSERRAVQRIDIIMRYLRLHSSDIAALGHGARVIGREGVVVPTATKEQRERLNAQRREIVRLQQEMYELWNAREQLFQMMELVFVQHDADEAAMRQRAAIALMLRPGTDTSDAKPPESTNSAIVIADNTTSTTSQGAASPAASAPESKSAGQGSATTPTASTLASSRTYTGGSGRVGGSESGQSRLLNKYKQAALLVQERKKKKEQ